MMNCALKESREGEERGGGGGGGERGRVGRERGRARERERGRGRARERKGGGGGGGGGKGGGRERRGKEGGGGGGGGRGRGGGGEENAYLFRGQSLILPLHAITVCCQSYGMRTRPHWQSRAQHFPSPLQSAVTEIIINKKIS